MEIPCDSGITTFIIIVSSRIHLVMIRFRSAIPELSETGIGRNRWEFRAIPELQLPLLLYHLVPI
jgi:hypothetical protein